MSLEKYKIEFYYKKTILTNIPNIMSEIKRLLDENLFLKYLEETTIEINEGDKISAFELIYLSDAILFHLKLFQETQEEYQFAFTISTNCIVGLYNHEIIKKVAFKSEFLDRILELLYKITDKIENNKPLKLEDKNKNIELKININNDLKSNVNSDLTSKNTNNFKTELSKTEFTKSDVTEELNLSNISVENIIFYVYLIVFLIVILIFSSSFFERKIRKFKNFVNEFNKKKVN